MLHEEVNRLPAKYCAPVVLCYLEGRTHDEAAAALQWPVGTVLGRLARARDLLRARLTAAVCAPSGWAGASLLGPAARIDAPRTAVGATVAAAIDGCRPEPSSRSANFMLAACSGRLKMTVAVLSIVLMLAGFGFALRDTPESQPQRAARSGRRHRRPTTQDRSTPVDLHGDPLPRYSRAAWGRFAFTMAPLSNRSSSPPTRSRWSRSIATLLLSMSGGEHGRRLRADRQARPSCRGFEALREGISLSPDGTTLATADF